MAFSAPKRRRAPNSAHDTTDLVIHDVPSISACGSWGRNDSNVGPAPYYENSGVAIVPGHFSAGSIATTIVSTNARSVVSPSFDGQSLVADLIEFGASGVAEAVSESGAFRVAFPQILCARYATCATAAEAYFASAPYLGWQNVFIGDPLMRRVAPDGNHDARCTMVCRAESIVAGRHRPPTPWIPPAVLPFSSAVDSTRSR